MRRAWADEPAETDFHEWRKQVKLLAAQLRLLCPIQPDELKTAAKQLDGIAEWLGEEHDLSVLGNALSGGADGHLEATAELETIRRLLDARRKELQKKALKHGGRLYKEKPAGFAEGLKVRWRRVAEGEELVLPSDEKEAVAGWSTPVCVVYAAPLQPSRT